MTRFQEIAQAIWEHRDAIRKLQEELSTLKAQREKLPAAGRKIVPTGDPVEDERRRKERLRMAARRAREKAENEAIRKEVW